MHHRTTYDHPQRNCIPYQTITADTTIQDALQVHEDDDSDSGFEDTSSDGSTSVKSSVMNYAYENGRC